MRKTPTIKDKAVTKTNQGLSGIVTPIVVSIRISERSEMEEIGWFGGNGVEMDGKWNRKQR